MKRIVIVILIHIACFDLCGQTVFTYGKKGVSREEFLKAYRKNNSSVPGNASQGIKEYLDLYIRYKLKVQAAYDEKLDTLATQKADLLNFRHSIEQNFMKDEAHVKALVNEAFERSRKDIHLAHLFVPFDENIIRNPGLYQSGNRQTDTVKARRKIQDAYASLASGKDFILMASALAQDEPAGTGGDLGWITVFSLPYELENAAYALSPGTYSKPIRSKGGYHILKNIEERPAIGRIKISQILLAFPPGSTGAEKKQLRKLADSLYFLLQGGTSFENLVKQYSEDRISWQANGQLPEFGVGRFDMAFEKAAFSLSKNGEISQPFETEYGIHILKLLERVPVPDKLAAASENLMGQVLTDNRMELARSQFEKEILGKIGFRQFPYDEKALWQVTDSFLLKNKQVVVKNTGPKTVLHAFKNSQSTVSDWLQFAKRAKTKQLPSYPEWMKQFIGESASTYYQAHLEDYDPEFRHQLNEFREGNLLFEIMEREVWGKAAADTMGLLRYYNQNKNKYLWGPSATAVFFTAADGKIAAEAQKKLSAGGLANWHQMAEESNGRILADSGRYEWTQLPIGNTEPRPGMLTAPVVSDQDSTVIFTYIDKVYPKPAPRNFEESKGLVINDYQNVLEEKWIAQLKKKYPVVINHAVVDSLQP